MGKKRTGVVGCGWFGRAHCRVYDEISDLTAVCDIDAQAAKETAGKYGVDWYGDYEEMAKAGLDAVSVVVPPEEIPRVSLEFASRGVDVLMEKPLGVRAEEAEEITTYSDSVRIVPGLIELFSPAFRILKENIDSAGDPVMVSSRRIGRFPRRFWRIGVVLDLAFHDLYLLMSLFGPLSIRDSVLSYHHDDQFEDAAAILVEFESGLEGIIEANWLTPIKERRLRVYGSEGVLESDFVTQEMTTLKMGRGDYGREERLRPYGLEEPLMDELSGFLYERDPPVKIEDGLEALRLALRASHRS